MKCDVRYQETLLLLNVWSQHTFNLINAGHEDLVEMFADDALLDKMDEMIYSLYVYHVEHRCSIN